MTDSDRVRSFGRFLGTAGRAHHAEFGGPNPEWPGWYAEYLSPGMAEHVGFSPTVDEITEWLRSASERHQAEAPDRSWPTFYAEVILEALEGRDGSEPPE